MFLQKIKEIFSRGLLFVFLSFLIVPEILYADSEMNAIRADLNDRDWQVRLAAVEKLDKRKDEEAVEILMKVAGTRSEYWPVKIKAIKLLGEAANPKAIGLLLTIFNDTTLNWECPAIKSYTALALGNFKENSKVINALLSGINDRELFTREASIQSLGKIGSTEAVPQLLDLLQDRSVAVKLSTINALEKIGDPQAISYLQKVADSDNDPIVKSEALNAIKNFR